MSEPITDDTPITTAEATAQQRLDATITELRKRINWLKGDPGTILSPDGYGEREGARGDLEEVLEIAEGKVPAQ